MIKRILCNVVYFLPSTTNGQQTMELLSEENEAEKARTTSLEEVCDCVTSFYLSSSVYPISYDSYEIPTIKMQDSQLLQKKG